MPDDHPLTIRLRGETQRPVVALALVLGIAFGYLALAGEVPRRVDGIASRIMCGAVSIALLLCAAYATWRWLNPSRWTVVIDADGVHDHASGKTMRWDEVYHVAYDERGGGITLAERPPAKARRPAMPGLTDARGHGIGINTENSDCDPIAILAAIKHFACAAGSGVEVPELVTRTRRRGAA